MKILLVLAVALISVYTLNAQTSTSILDGTFKKRRIGMSTRPYKPAPQEKPFYDGAVKSAVPSQLMKYPEKYQGRLIHLLGIVDSVYQDEDSTSVTILLEHKYWDYLEDYSIQDEVMFVSPIGDGKFEVRLNGLTRTRVDSIQSYPGERKLFLIYGLLNGFNRYPVIATELVKVIDYKFYSTSIFSYEAKRDTSGNVQVDKKGEIEMTNFKILRVAGRGQNK